ncbi:MAG: cytochrome c peroxidase [Pseudomonadota bacterium]
MGRAAAVLTCIAACALSSAQAGSSYQWKLPRGFPEPAVPADNPMSDAKVALGRQLFADTRLSSTGRYSCQSCHAPERAFTDGLPRSRGATGETLPLNAPTLLNTAYNASLGWSDARVRTFEQQMRGPMFNEHPVELGLAGRESSIERTLLDDAALAQAFAAAFPGESQAVTVDNTIRAIAAYLRTLLSASSPFDRYVFGGDHAALDVAQKRGMALFFSARSGCSACHAGINFANAWIDSEHTSATPVFADTGTGQFVRVPTLRNLGMTAPYMHDGRFATLDAVLDHYEKLAVDPGADARLRRAQLTTGERQELAEFLLSLNDAR